ncbi:MAG: OmpW family outer membrane protein [Rhizobiaceae bacterium]
MNNFLKTGLVLAVILVITGLTGLSQGALAADLDPTYVRGGRTNVEYGSGWYLRGNVGFSLGNGENQSFNDGTNVFSFVRQNEDNGYSAGVGFGYTFNPYFRVDTTIDYHGGRDWNGLDAGAAVTNDSSFELTNYSLNGYVSLGKTMGITPYIGAGFGVADVKWGGHSISGVGTRSGESYQGSTYSVMAGFDYRLDKNWLFDFEYKYTHVDGGKTIADSGVSSNTAFSDDFNLQDFRIGLRYEIW